jgi:hypothetical protein
MKLRPGAVVLVVFGQALFGCEESPAEVPDLGDEDVMEESFVPFERPTEIDGTHRWIPGDLHVHSSGASNDTPRHSTPERIREVAIERGVEFVVLTDHSNSTGSDPYTLEEDPALFNQGPEFPHWDRVAALSDEQLILVQGNELSPVHPTEAGPTGHIGCVPGSLETFDPNIAFIDRPRGEVTGGQALRQAIDAGCFAILNHPYGPLWTSYDWTSYDYHGMEVWNGGARFSLLDVQGMRAWACDLSQGRRVTPVGASDNHDVESEPPGGALKPALGIPVTWVWAPALSWPEIIAGLEQGAVSISDTGVPLEIDAFDGEGRFQAMAGGESSPGEIVLRVRGSRQVDGPAATRYLEVIRQPAGACDDTRAEFAVNVPEPNWEVLYRLPVAVGESVDELVHVVAQANDAFFAWIVPELPGSDQDVAISGAIFVGAE